MLINFPKDLKRIKIGNIYIKLEEDNNTEFLGVSNYTKEFILLNTSKHSSIQSFKDTLLHELLHIIWKHFCLEDSDEEERVVSIMSTGLMQVMDDNPKLKRYLFND